MPDQQLFVVRGFMQNYVVSLYPQETCSCKLKTYVHIRAAKLSVGDSQPHSKKAGKKGTSRLNIGWSSWRFRGFISRNVSCRCANCADSNKLGNYITKKRFLDPKKYSNITFTEVMSSTRLTRRNMESINSVQKTNLSRSVQFLQKIVLNLHRTKMTQLQRPPVLQNVVIRAILSIYRQIWNTRIRLLLPQLQILSMRKW